MLEALRLGCPAIGFSGHSYAPYDEAYCMSPAQTETYKAEISRLREKYAGRIRIYMGIEQDFYSPSPTVGYDYVIGSVHYLYRDGTYLPVDASQSAQEQAVQAHYGGDWYAFAEDYFAAVAQVYERTRCQVVGHFDLVTKFNEGDALFPRTIPVIAGRSSGHWMPWLPRLWSSRSIPGPFPGATAQSRTRRAGSWRSCAAGA